MDAPDDKNKDDKNKDDAFSRIIEEKEKRKLKALRQSKGVWYGLGMFGMVGWSVAVPAILGVFAGKWLDEHYPQAFSWTLTGLALGLAAGCLIAWNWINKEDARQD